MEIADYDVQVAVIVRSPKAILREIPMVLNPHSRLASLKVRSPQLRKATFAGGRGKLEQILEMSVPMVSLTKEQSVS
jgi:hypothetical protein